MIQVEPASTGTRRHACAWLHARSPRFGTDARSRSLRSTSGRYRMSSPLRNLRVSSSSSDLACSSQSRSNAMNLGSARRKRRSRHCGLPSGSRQTISPSRTQRRPFRSRANPSVSEEKDLNTFPLRDTSRTPSLSEQSSARKPSHLISKPVCVRERRTGSAERCALKTHGVQSPEMETAAKPSPQPRTKSCVMPGDGHCEA
jgi:hypothetical protein